MFGGGWGEMLLIGVVALIVIGPKDLPVVLNRIGKIVGSIRRMGSEFQREINKTTGLDTITDLRRSITEPLRQTAAEITREFNKVTPAGTVVPSGAIAPASAAAESVVDEIHAKIGVPETPPATPKPVESPAPIEAIAPAKPARKPRAKKAVAPDVGPIVEVSRSRQKLVAEEAVAEKLAAPRKPRVAKPKSEA